MRHSTLYFNNQWQIAHGPLLTSCNPATGEIIWEGKSANASDVNRTVQAARAAFPAWAKIPLETKKAFLRTFKGILEKEKMVLAEIISLENGKPLWDALNEVSAMINKIDISIEAYAGRCPNMIINTPERQMTALHRPHGVIAILGPFNFPAHLPNGHLIPALLAGNTIIFKPSEMTPLVAEKMLQLWEQVDLPPGVLNLLQGAHRTGRHLAEHPGIDGLFFTGSWNTGKFFTKYFAKLPGKMLVLEMGGNNPLIVTEVEDLQASARLAIQSAYLTSGQRCTCARRLIVPYGNTGDAFLQELITLIKALSVGPYTDLPEPFMGPVISSAAAEKLLQAQAMMMQQGGRPLLEMTPLAKNIAFLSPGLIDVTATPSRPDEEHFGPLLQLIRVNSFEEAIDEAGRTEYGLTAGLLSNNPQEFELLAQHLKVGMLCWNSPTTNASSALPFGGTGKSGNFRPTAYYAADYCSYPMIQIKAPF